MKTSNIPVYSSLPETEKKKLQVQFHESDLNYLASYAIENGTLRSDDMDDLLERIDKRAASGGSAFFNGFVLVMAGMLIGGTLFFMIFREQQTHASHAELIEQPKEKMIITKTEKQEVVPADNIEAYVKEHFSIHHPAEEIQRIPESYEELASRDLDHIDAPVNKETQEQAIDLDNIPNAPVIYIADLKVANYKTLYFRNDKSINLNESGLAAEFSDRSSATTDKTILAEKNYYAHEMLRDALVFFNHKDYASAAESLQELYRFNKKDVNAVFYLGMCFYYLHQSQKAAGLLSEVQDNTVNVFRQEAEFYRALSLTEAGHTEEGRAVLKAIVSKHSFYSERAAELLQKMD